MEFETEADSTDKSQPFEIMAEDITEHDDMPRPYLCTVCDRRFTKKKYLNAHRRIHTEDNVYSCSECGKRCSSQNALRIHKYIHTGKYKCTECDKGFRSSTDLARHNSRIHSGEKPYKCHMCDNAFSESGDLNTHMRVHTGDKPYKCHMCDKAFSQSGDLNTHMRVHTGEKPYKCHMCDKTFSRSSHLHSHIRHVHSNRRPYRCPYCGKTFDTEDDLKCHVHIHTGVKPYSYRHCSERFTRREQLEMHLLKSHNEGNWLVSLWLEAYIIHVMLYIVFVRCLWDCLCIGLLKLSVHMMTSTDLNRWEITWHLDFWVKEFRRWCRNRLNLFIHSFIYLFRHRYSGQYKTKNMNSKQDSPGSGNKVLRWPLKLHKIY